MSSGNRTARPSLSPVISKPISSKLLNKNNSTQITKSINAPLKQPTLLRHTNNSSITTTSTTTHHTPTPSPSATSANKDNIYNPDIRTNNTVQNTIRNYASATANISSPSRDQALVFNSIDGIPQRDYILAIGKIISPKNIVFVSRISNNRFCIFLSSKQILDLLLESTQYITINDQQIPIRRLINPSKRIVISNVCPSIPNHVILDALKNINITPVSEIAYLKAGINIEGYEHILSFRRQIYIKNEDLPNLPGSLPLLHNETEFRVFFTDDRITCFLCKSSGHNSNTCNKIDVNPQTSTKSTQPVTLDEPSVEKPYVEEPSVHLLTNTDNLETSVHSPSIKNPHRSTPQSMEGIIEVHQTNDTLQLTLPNQTHISENISSFNEPHKRPLSDSSFLVTPSSPPPANSSSNETCEANIDRSRNIKKKKPK